MSIQIKNYWNGAVIFTSEEATTLAQAVEEAVRKNADLSGADLRSADLRSADLRSADLRSADLRSADLRSANLRSANLSGANLSGANLSGANLSPIRNDFWDVLLRATHEVAGLRLALVEGRVNGSAYHGECACLVGTIANVKKCNIEQLAIEPDSGRPIEKFFLGISKGDTAETNQHVKIAIDWIDEFTTLLKA